MTPIPLEVITALLAALTTVFVGKEGVMYLKHRNGNGGGDGNAASRELSRERHEAYLKGMDNIVVAIKDMNRDVVEGIKDASDEARERHHA